MKEAIEKAIENGFDLKKQFFPYLNGSIKVKSWYYIEYETAALTRCDLTIYSKQPAMLHICANHFSIYDIIFGTDFIDKLIYPVTGIGNIPNMADFNRAQMSNPKISRDINKLKKYVRKLCE